MATTRAVFVHGNPETAAIWGPLLETLQHPDAVTLSPPGFGAPVPAGFDATPGGYAAWLIAQLESMGRPVDLVGHDWGAGHVMRVALDRPDLIRSWAMSCHTYSGSAQPAMSVTHERSRSGRAAATRCTWPPPQS